MVTKVINMRGGTFNTDRAIQHVPTMRYHKHVVAMVVQVGYHECHVLPRHVVPFDVLRRINRLMVFRCVEYVCTIVSDSDFPNSATGALGV